MASERAKGDVNYKAGGVVGGYSSADAIGAASPTIVILRLNPTTGRLLVDVNGPSTGVTDGEAVDAADLGTLAVGTDGANYQILNTDSDGHLQVDVLSGGGGGTQYAVDAALGATPTGTLAIAIRDDALSALTPVEGDAIGLRVDANGALWTHDDALDAALGGSELQVDVVGALPAGTNAIGKLAANSGVDIGDVDVLSIAAGDNNIGNVDIVSLPAGNLGMQLMAASLSVVPASNITDATYIGDIKFGESLPAGTNGIGKLTSNSGVDIGDVDILSIAAGDNNIGNVDIVSGTITTVSSLGNSTTGPQKAEDAASANGDVGIPAMAVQKATPANTAGLDGDYEFLQMSAGRLWTSATIDAALPTGSNAIGKLAANSGVDIGDVDVTSVVPGTGATSLGKAVDSARGATDTGVQMLAVRDDTLSVFANAENDYEPLHLTAAGRLYTSATIDAALPAGTNAIGKLAANSGVDIGDVDILSIAAGDNNIGNVDIVSGTITTVSALGTGSTGPQKAEDAGHTTADAGIYILGVRNDTPNTALTGSDADYGSISLYRTGAVRTAIPEEDFAALGSNHVKKYYTNAGAVTDGIVWSPAAGKRWYVTDIFINTSAAAVITLEDDLSGGDSAVWKAELAANSGWSHSFATPLFSGEDAADLLVTTSAGNVYITVTGYEI